MNTIVSSIYQLNSKLANFVYIQPFATPCLVASRQTFDAMFSRYIHVTIVLKGLLLDAQVVS